MRKDGWDVFISYASEDKDKVVKPLAEILSKFGLSVWFDEFELKPGDSLSRSLDRGLANSRYGLVVLSRMFLEKKWPEYELRGLTLKEIKGKGVLVPVWYEISQDEIMAYSPSLAEKVAIPLEDNKLTYAAIQIIDVVKPELFERIIRRAAFESAKKGAAQAYVTAENVRFSPTRHKELPTELIRRIRLIRAALMVAQPYTMDYWVEGFKRDAHPSQEISEWERIAAAYLEFVSIAELTEEQHKTVLMLLNDISVGHKIEDLKEASIALPKHSLDVLVKLMHSERPLWDFADVEDGRDLSEAEHHSAKEELLDKETHPNDVPTELVKRFLDEMDESEG